MWPQRPFPSLCPPCPPPAGSRQGSPSAAAEPLGRLRLRGGQQLGVTPQNRRCQAPDPRGWAMKLQFIRTDALCFPLGCLTAGFTLLQSFNKWKTFLVLMTKNTCCSPGLPGLCEHRNREVTCFRWGCQEMSDLTLTASLSPGAPAKTWQHQLRQDVSYWGRHKNTKSNKEEFSNSWLFPLLPGYLIFLVMTTTPRGRDLRASVSFYL